MLWIKTSLIICCNYRYASKTQSKLGFVTPFNHQRYLTGYDSNTQVHLPLKVKIDVDVENTKVYVKLQPLNPNKYQKIAEYSTMAYTTKHDILDLTPPQLDDDTEITHVRPVNRVSSYFQFLIFVFYRIIQIFSSPY